MCGIVGWVDFERDLRKETELLTRMTDTLAARGPDGSGYWLGRRAAVGHRRLAVLDPGGSAQPMTTSRGVNGQPVVIAYNGEIYNFAELRSELRSLGHQFSTRGDTEVVLRSYLQWGAESVSRMVGMFAYAIWDGDTATLTLFRDRLGVKPLYFHRYPGGLLWASEPKAILAHPLFQPRLAQEMLPVVFNPRLKVAGDTVLTDLREVRPASVLEVSARGDREHRYWALHSAPHHEDAEATVDTVRDLLEVIVRQQLVADRPVCTLLSGGLDSTAITSLVSRHTTGLPSFCVDFAGSAEDFKSTPLRPERDTNYARAASRHFGTAHTDVVLDPAEVVAGSTKAMLARDLPSLGQFDSSMLQLFGAVKASCTVALSGEAADEIFGGYPWFHESALLNSDTFPWLGKGSRLTDCLAPEVRNRIRPADQERDSYRSALAQVPRLEGESGLPARMREALYLSMQGPLHLLLDRTDRMSMAAGVEVRVPFCDHRLVEYLWNVPWQVKNADGREKSLLRAAMRGLLPAELLNRRKSAYPAMFAAEYDNHVLGSVEQILTDPSSRLSGLLDAGRVRRLVRRAKVSVAWASTAHLLTPLVETEAWLREYDVRIT